MENISGTKVHGLLQNGESWLGRQKGALRLEDNAPFSFLKHNSPLGGLCGTGFAKLLMLKKLGDFAFCLVAMVDNFFRFERLTRP